MQVHGTLLLLWMRFSASCVNLILGTWLFSALQLQYSSRVVPPSFPQMSDANMFLKK
jgi:hypothetical protein